MPLNSTYSLLDAHGTPKQLIERAKELGRKTIALTDHGSTSGYVQFWKACKEAEIKPIFGYEAYFVPSLEKMFENKERKKNHLTILASNETGYKNLLRIVSQAYQKGFYYYPTIDWDMLEQNSSGLIVFSGCWSGMLQRALVEARAEDAESFVGKAKEIFGSNFFLETQHYSLHQQTFPTLMDLSTKFDVPVVLTCDCHYSYDGQANVQEILHCVRDRRTFDPTKLINEAYQWEPEQLYKMVEERFGSGHWGKIFKNVLEVADRCNVEMPQGNFPSYTTIDGRTADEEFDDKCKEGIVYRGLQGAGMAYKERFAREKKVLKEKGFVDYLLITADVIRWAKENGILVGGGRGSSAGSLICYLLGITELDPIKHGLLFERFIDETRADPPDIDTDFESEGRTAVKEYIAQKYGQEKVCEVATFAEFKGKNSLDEIGKIFSIPKNAVETVKKYLIERSSGDMRSQLTIEDTFKMSEDAMKVSEQHPEIKYAALLEGQLRHMSVHAAGVIIGSTPLEDAVAVYENNEGRKISALEMKDAAFLGYIKMDFLGLKELSIIKKAANMVGMSIEDIYAIPRDDEETLNGFKEVDVEGIFQFNGDSTKSVLRQMPYLDFEQLAACVALSKPGSSHCLHGKTLVYDCDSDEIIPISKAYKRKTKRTLSLFPDGSIRPQEIAEHLRFGEGKSGKKQRVHAVYFGNGRCIEATSEHWFLAETGWKKLSELVIGDKIFSLLEDYKLDSLDFAIVTRIEPRDERTVYDFRMKEEPNYLANGLVVHNSGGTTNYIARMRGNTGVPGFDWHPLLNELTKETYNQIIYQEQILSILRQFANFSVTEANECRRIVAKSIGEQEFDKHLPNFLEGTKDKITEPQARRIWDSLKVYGRYGFNKSHAMAYALLAFWSMYMKRHHPAEFFLAKLDYVKTGEDTDKFRIMMDASNHGINIAPPCLGKSKVGWTIDGDKVMRAGITEIKGIGGRTAENIINCGFTRKDEFAQKIKGVNVGVIKKLEEAHAFSDSEPIEDFFKIRRFDILDKIASDRVPLSEIRDWDKSYHVKIAGIFAELNFKDIFEEKASRGKAIKSIKDPEKAKYAMLLLEDQTDRCLVHIDRYLWHDISQEVWDAYDGGKIVVIEGSKVSGWRMIRAQRVSIYEEDGNG